MATSRSGTADRRTSMGLAIMRFAFGATFLAHGAMKVFVMGLGNMGGAFTQMGVPLPGITGPLVALVELLGGAALIIGLLTRLAALGLFVDMLGAVALVRIGGGFFAPKGAELEIVLGAAAFAIAVAGAGEYSIDAAIARRRFHA